MTPLLLGALVTLAQPPGVPDRGAAGDRPADRAGAAGMMLDGTWTVVAIERQGRAVPTVRTATLRNNVLTFDAAGGGASGTGGDRGGAGTGTGTGGTGTGGAGVGATGTGALLPMRLEFGPTGTVRVMEMAGGAGGAGGTGGAADRAGGAEAAGGGASGRTGVYVMTSDYLALSVLDTGTGSDLTAGGRAGGTGTGGTDRGAGGAATGMSSRPYLTLLLRRSGTAGGTGR